MGLVRCELITCDKKAFELFNLEMPNPLVLRRRKKSRNGARGAWMAGAVQPPSPHEQHIENLSRYAQFFAAQLRAAAVKAEEAKRADEAKLASMKAAHKEAAQKVGHLL